MYEAIVKAKTAGQLKALREHSIDINEHSAMRAQTDFLYRVDAIVSDEDIRRLVSAGYAIEIVSDLSITAKERLNEVSRTNRFNEKNKVTHEKK
jgi:hypothetical protein